MDVPEDDFKGFGEGFTGFPKRLPEDCVEYSLFVIDSKLKTQKELLAQLEAIRKESVKLAENLLKEYIWQRESFKLELESSIGSMHLHGVTNYGDSVEDEWLIVYILRELSNRYTNLWIKVADTDGEFLLIEAANALPRWLNPEIADNRVWIHQNNLRIIPRTAATSSSSKQTAPVLRPLTLDEARATIIATPEALIHSPLIEEEAFYRLRNYPAQINASMHHATITIPRKLAYMLHELPSSIAPAVEAFYLRDPIALKLLQASESGLAFPPKDLVTVSTVFTRILYAQIKCQEFPASTSWKEHLSAEKSQDLNATSLDELEKGMKVTSGFEMLVKDPSNRDHRVVRELNILLDDLETDSSISLPTDAEIALWKDVKHSDPETWLEINFADFEAELQGKPQNKLKSQNGAPKTLDPEEMSGFGDAKTQADLKKMVERFESFLNDDDAGIDGAEMDDMDVDDDDDNEEDSEEDSEDEDKDVSFDEMEFARMMREMMGLPSEEPEDEIAGARSSKSQMGKIEEVDTDEEDDRDEVEEMRKVMDAMDAELKEAGALNLDPPPRTAALKGRGNSQEHEDWEDESDEDGEVDIDFNLAKNLLESFKSQVGTAGPGGNLMGMMGVHLPRDEGPASRKS